MQELQQALGPNSQTEIMVLPEVGFGGMVHGFDPSPVASRDADDLAWLFYTSGTTGRPKGVEITHGMMQSMALSYFVDVDQVFDSDVALYAAPMSHGAGLYNLLHVMKGAGMFVPYLAVLIRWKFLPLGHILAQSICLQLPL